MLSFVICGIGDVCPASVNLSKWISSIIYLVSVYVLWRRMCCVCVCERRQFVAICFHVEHQKRHMMEWNEIICLWRLINMSVVYAMKLRNYALEWEWNKFGVAVIVCFFFVLPILEVLLGEFNTKIHYISPSDRKFSKTEPNNKFMLWYFVIKKEIWILVAHTNFRQNYWDCTVILYGVRSVSDGQLSWAAVEFAAISYLFLVR